MTSLYALLEELVDADFGAGDLKAVRATLGGRGDDAFPAAQAAALLNALSAAQRRTPAQVYQWAGARLVGPITKLLPHLAKGHTSARSMLLQMSPLASAAAAELLPDAACPEFWEDYLDGETIRIGFDGPEEAAWLLEGVFRGLAEQFGERVVVSRPDAPPTLAERRLIDVKVIAERRSGRPSAGLSASGSRS